MAVVKKQLNSTMGGDPIVVWLEEWHAMTAMNLPHTAEYYKANRVAIVNYVKAHKGTPATSGALAAVLSGSIPSVTPGFVPNPKTNFASVLIAAAQTSTAPAENQAPCVNCAGEDAPASSDLAMQALGAPAGTAIKTMLAPTAPAGIVDVNPTLQINGGVIAVAALLAWLVFFRK